MSYQELDEVITLTMSKEDFASIVLALGMAAGVASRDGLPIRPWLELADRINEGNPRWNRYTDVSSTQSSTQNGLTC